MCEAEIQALDIVSTLYEEEAQPLSPDSPAGRRVASAISIAEDGFDASFGWALAACAWLDFFGRAGLDEAIRCARRSLPDVAFTHWWVEAARAYIKIGEYRHEYLADAREMLQGAEQYIMDSSDARMCAGTWIGFPGREGRRQALRLLKRAEELYDSDDEEMRLICRSWVHCFGEAGARQMRKFLRRIGCMIIPDA